MNNKKYVNILVVLENGKEVFRGSPNECFVEVKDRYKIGFSEAIRQGKCDLKRSEEVDGK